MKKILRSHLVENSNTIHFVVMYPNKSSFFGQFETIECQKRMQTYYSTRNIPEEGGKNNFHPGPGKKRKQAHVYPCKTNSSIC